MSYEHLTSERIQALLDGQASPAEVRSAEVHAGTCGRCLAEWDAWRAVFAELGELPAHAPRLDFAARVMAGMAPEGLALAPQPATRVRHPGTERLVEYLEARLPLAAEERVRAHVAACEPCATEVTEWRGLVAALEGLDHLAPAAGFTDRVMARVEVPAPVPALRLLAARAVRRLIPADRKRWAALAGLGTAPAAVFGLMAWVVLSNPLVTLGSLASFAGWKIAEVASLLSENLLGPVAQSLAAFRAYSAVGTVLESPATWLAGGLLFCVMTLFALWVLYKNLLLAPSAGRMYASANV